MTPGTMADLNARLQRHLDAAEATSERVECAELRAEECEREAAKLRQAGEALSYSLRVYSHAHANDNAVPPFCVDAATAALAAWQEVAK